MTADEAYRVAALPGDAVGWRSVGYVVVDLETTGLDPRADEVISYAAIPIDAGRVRLSGLRQGLVRPSRPIPPSSILIHGIRPGDVADAAAQASLVDALLPVLTGRVLVVHVDWVERGFLGQALAARRTRLREPVLDTARLARAVLGSTGLDPFGLAGLARGLGLPVHARHEALGDALTTAQVFLALAARLERDVPLTLGGLRRAGSARRRWTRLRQI